VDIHPDVSDKVYVSAFLSLFELTTKQGGSALRLAPARNSRFGKPDTLTPPIHARSEPATTVSLAGSGSEFVGRSAFMRKTARHSGIATLNPSYQR
jgi:hypothetical protein